MVVFHITGQMKVVASGAALRFWTVVKICQYGSSEPITESRVLKFSHLTQELALCIYGTFQKAEGRVEVFHLIENDT